MTQHVELGAGGMPRPGFWSIDLNAATRPHLLADVRCLPLRTGSVSELVAADVLEHVLPWDVGAALREWARVLAAGGTMRLRVPNLAELGRLVHFGIDVDDSIRNIYGGHRWGPDGAWDCHHHGFTPSTLAVALDCAGLVVVHNDEASNMTATARKP